MKKTLLLKDKKKNETPDKHDRTQQLLIQPNIFHFKISNRKKKTRTGEKAKRRKQNFNTNSKQHKNSIISTQYKTTRLQWQVIATVVYFKCNRHCSSQ